MASAKRFVKEAAEGSATEIALGKLAEEKGSSEAVKQFGKRMVDDHSKAGGVLKQMAGMMKIDVPSDMPKKAKKAQDKLSKLSGADFDRAYAKMMVSDHKGDVNDFEKEARDGAVPGVKDFAAKMLPTLQEHLKLAQELYASAGALEKVIAGLPGVEDVTSDVAVTTPQVNVSIDRDKAAAMGVNASQIENALYDAYGPRWVSTIYGSANEYKVLLELMPKYQADPRALSLLYFKNPTSRLIPLDTLARVVDETGPQTINHYGQLPAATISFNLKPGAALGEVVDQIQGLATRTLPNTISTQFQGAAKAFQSSLGNLWVLLIIAIMVVYIVLGILYESYIHPITILSGLPSAGFGALLTLVIFKIDLSIYAFVGLIMLIGIVKKNAIMQIDFALEAERHHNLSAEKAIYEGCLIRFRPIMMTTMAALLGAVPIALGYGAGGEARQPLGLVVVGGLLFSQLVTLYLTPVVYTYMAQLQTWLRSRKPARAMRPAAAHD